MRLLLDYARERLTPGRLLPAVLLVVVAVLAGRGWTGRAALAKDALLALALVITFRIWDDLTDRERDRLKHPERVVVRASSLASLQLTSWFLATGSLVALSRVRTRASALLLVAYIALLLAAYGLRSERSAAAERILLLKYGVFTLALIGLPAALGARGLLAAAAAFLVACVYEWWHDAESPVFSFGGSR